MSYASLAEKIKLLPEEYLDEIDKYVEKLLLKLRNKSKDGNTFVNKPKGLDELSEGELDKKLDNTFEELKAGKCIPLSEAMKKIRAL